MLDENKLKNRIATLTKLAKFKGIKDDAVAETIAHDIVIENKYNENYNAKAVIYKTQRYFRDSKLMKNSALHIDDELIEVVTELSDRRVSKQFEDIEIQYSIKDVIESLVANADEETKSIVEEFLRQEKATCNSVAKALNTNNKKVQRKLSKLVNNYDEKKFNNIFLYIAS